MTRVAQHPIKAFAAALAAVAVLSTMDAVMKHLVIAIGIYSVSVWRSLLNLIMAAIIYLPRRAAWPSRRVM
jgi:S-adenosylmethionine uptake transporter